MSRIFKCFVFGQICSLFVEIRSCSGPSMFPTLNINGDYILIWKTNNVKFGDVVVAENNGNHVCKRVLGLEGDYILNNNDYVQVPKDSVWLIGDNMANSRDSRTYGFVPNNKIHGRVLMRVFPKFSLMPPLETQVTSLC